ncbi:type IV toxin-antitoxin system AbiEi family antitoxin domain-containing protein [Arthrobacter sp. TMS2-4]
MAAPINSTRILWRYRELLDEGLSRQHVHHLVVSGELRRLRKNCYVPEAHWAGLSTVERLALQARAHQHGLVGRDTVGHVYSHETAAVLHGLDLWRPGNDVHVTQPTRTSNASHGADVRNHSAQLEEDDVVLLHGLPVTSLLRTAVDCARTLPFDRALIVADQSMARGVTRSAALTAVDQLGPAAGVGRASAVITAADPLSESPGETLTRSRLLRFGLPPALSQVEVSTRRGRYRLDFAWPELLVGLEFDGRVKYFGAAVTDEVLYEERRRERALVEEGWTILRIEWSDLFREAELEARLRGALCRAASRIAA